MTLCPRAPEVWVWDRRLVRPGDRSDCPLLLAPGFPAPDDKHKKHNCCLNSMSIQSENTPSIFPLLSLIPMKSTRSKHSSLNLTSAFLDVHGLYIILFLFLHYKCLFWCSISLLLACLFLQSSIILSLLCENKPMWQVQSTWSSAQSFWSTSLDSLASFQKKKKFYIL